jgi:hypothetical protein
VRLTSLGVLAPLLTQLLGLWNAPWMSVHEVGARLCFGKRVPLRSMQNIFQRHCTMHLVQSVPHMWNVVIAEVRHEEQIFASSSG